jgi:hypothetical protein
MGSESTRKKLTLTPFILFLALPAFAGRPLTTDDAATLDTGQCQVETWVDHSRDVVAGWFVPSCNFGAGIEWQVGFARSRELGVEHLSEGYAQAKTVLRASRDDSPWAMGLTAGVTRRPLAETHRGWEHPYVIVPVTVTSGAFTFHTSPGWARNRETGRDSFLWGVAFEWAVNDRVDFVGETFGEGSGDPLARAGFRWMALKDSLWIDLTQVVRVGGERSGRFTSLGLTWVIPFAR